jgi:hypothetical protein
VDLIYDNVTVASYSLGILLREVVSHSSGGALGIPDFAHENARNTTQTQHCRLIACYTLFIDIACSWIISERIGCMAVLAILNLMDRGLIVSQTGDGVGSLLPGYAICYMWPFKKASIACLALVLKA